MNEKMIGVGYLKIYWACDNLDRFDIIIDNPFYSEEYAHRMISSAIRKCNKHFLYSEIDFNNLNKKIMIYGSENQNERFRLEYEMREEEEMLKLTNKNNAEERILTWFEEEKIKDPCLKEKLEAREFTTKELLDYCCGLAREQANEVIKKLFNFGIKIKAGE